MHTPPVQPARSRGAGGSATCEGVGRTFPPRRLLLVALLASVLTLTQAFAATIDVTTTVDELDFVPNGLCSLREAIVSVNEGRNVGGCTASGTYGNADTVNLPAGAYYLTRVRLNGTIHIEPDQDVGNLNLNRSVRLIGAGAGATIIDGYYVGSISTTGDYLLGGGVFDVLDAAIVRLEGLTITGGGAAYGGGIYSTGNLTLYGVSVEDNESLIAGGGIMNWGQLTIENSTVARNVADEGSDRSRGGGIFNRGTLHAQNVTISGNMAGVGGGLATDINAQAEVRTTLSSVTISGNEALGNGGGVDRDDEGRLQVGESRFYVESTLIAGNVAEGTSPDCRGTFESFDFNLIGDATGCSGFNSLNDQKGSSASPLDPLLAELANYGGSTHTHALLPGSPAIDRGPLQILESCPATDQRGVPRANDGDGNGFMHCDIGAYEAPTLVTPQANLEVELAVAPEPVGAGGSLSYTMTLTNHGPNDAESVEYVLEAPGTVTEAPPDCSISGNVAICAHGALSVGRITRQFAVTAPATQGVAIAVVTVSSTTEDPDTSDNEAQLGSQVVAQNSADLALEITGPSSALPDAELTYVLTVRNLGPETSGHLTRIAAQVPPNTEFLEASSGCTRFNQLVNCVVGPLAHGSSVAVELTLRAPASPGTVTLAASAQGDEGQDGVPTNNNASWGTRIDVPRELSADLALTKLAPEQVQPGSSFDYLLVVANHGPDAATDVVITDTLPGGALLETAGPDCSHSAGTVTCELEGLPVGANESIRLTVTAPTAEGELRNVATVESGVVDPDGSNNEAAVTTQVTADAPVGIPQLELAPHADAARELAVAAGERGVLALRFEATAGASEGVTLDALDLRLLTQGSPQPAGRVAWYLDADGDGSPDEPTPLAEGLFESGRLTLAPPLAKPPGATVAAGATAGYLVLVDLGSAAAYLPAGDGTVITAVMRRFAAGAGGAVNRSTQFLAAASLPILLTIMLITVMQRRRRSDGATVPRQFGATAPRPLGARAAPLLLALALAAVLAGCQTAGPGAQQRGSHQLVLDSVSASGAITMTEAEVTGLPLEGALIEVR